MLLCNYSENQVIKFIPAAMWKHCFYEIFFSIRIFERNGVIAQNSDFLISISLLPDVV